MKDPYTFQCKRCGNCCRGKGLVYLSWTEMKKIAQYLKMNIVDFELTYLDTWNGKKVLKNKRNENCIFLENNLCKIHKVKPKQCKKWPFWKELFEQEEVFWDAHSFCEGLKEFTFEDFQKSKKKPSLDQKFYQ